MEAAPHRCKGMVVARQHLRRQPVHSGSHASFVGRVMQASFSFSRQHHLTNLPECERPRGLGRKHVSAREMSLRYAFHMSGYICISHPADGQAARDEPHQRGLVATLVLVTSTSTGASTVLAPVPAVSSMSLLRLKSDTCNRMKGNSSAP